MGSASSRSLQKLPKLPKNTLSDQQLCSAVEPEPPNPNLLSNLAQLGQVRVDVDNKNIPVNPVNPPQPHPFGRTHFTQPNQPPNVLSASALSTLLDILKSDQHAPTLAHAKHIVHQHQFNLDWDVYKRLATYVNTPTIARQIHIQLTDNSVRILKEVIWVDPAYTRTL